MAHKNKTNLSPYQRPRRPTNGLKGRHRPPAQIYSVEEANDRLYDIFRNHQFTHINHEQRFQLAQFYSLLMTQQKTENLTRLTHIKDIAIKHFIDCLIVPQLTAIEFPLLDVGTGPGFPGIPLKILFPDSPIILAEGVQKRVEFLKKVRDELKLQNLSIIGRNIKADFSLPVQSVITRAVEDVSNTLSNVANCLNVGGQIILMKGPQVDPEIKAAEKLREFYSLEKNISYQLPNTPHQRRLLVFRKIKPVSIL